MASLKEHSHESTQTYTQDPIAVVGMSCRLPGQSNSPSSLWDFLERGGIASNDVPATRFNLEAHHVGSPKPNTMRSPGGMYLENIDPRDFDAPFFNVSREDAIACDPQQRQLLEVVYEGLENAGITLESLDGAPVACFVASFTCDYGDMLGRNPEDRPPGTLVGLGRAILSNRISHFLNIKGPSVTLDTACSGTLQGIDIASRYLQTREVTAAIVAGANLFLSPEHNMDIGNMKTAHSLSGRCHTFDKKADGYSKAEAVNAVILKRLDDAIRDGDAIRAVIRGTATNSDGRTPGIASPSSEAQARAIRSAYANAGISDYRLTSYLECHGTGTQAGDPIELNGAASVFAATRAKENPLMIGSIKSNVGHSEPSAGISGLLKTVLSLERGIIPGNPTFDIPNPKIDFEKLRVRPSKATTPWPDVAYRRASINSFGFGGSNAHAVVDGVSSYLGRDPDAHCFSYIPGEEGLFEEQDIPSQPVTLVFSANDKKSLKLYVKALSDHLINPNVQVKLPDLAYTLSHRRTRHFHRGYLVTQDPMNIDQGKLVVGKQGLNAPRIGFVFTGQGAQWPKMGKALLDTFPSGKVLIKKLDAVLQSLPENHRPPWSLLAELTEARKAQHLRQPEFSQPIVTALQLVILEILDSWGIKPETVVGHSSGEIAAACAAGYLTQEEAIKIAFYRGHAVVLDGAKTSLGMLAVGLGPNQVQEYIGGLHQSVQIGCFNSPNSVTLSGESSALEMVKQRIENDKHFARLLQVDIAYHSKFMQSIAACYKELLLQNCDSPIDAPPGRKATMYSSVTGHHLEHPCDAAYWMNNMESPVRFDQAVQAMVSAPDNPPDFLIEIGPSGALAGPISQITAKLSSPIQYCAALSRGKDAIEALFAVAGRLFISGGDVDLTKVNTDDNNPSNGQPRLIVDLPNYVWNHSIKYWHESDASKDWRFRKFPHHDILGGKVLGTSWDFPSFSKILRIKDQPWLRDHAMGSEVIFPAAGFISMAIEAIYQSYHALKKTGRNPSAERPSYRLRNVRFDKALVLEEDVDTKMMLNLAPHFGSKDTWYDFKINSSNEGSWTEHSSGMIRLEPLSNKTVPRDQLTPLEYPKSGTEWYRAFNSIGYGYGPEFQKIIAVEAVEGSLTTRNHISLKPPLSSLVQSEYPLHPCTMDACIQAFIPSVWRGDRCAVDTVLLPAIIDELTITTAGKTTVTGVAIASSKYSGKGRIGDKRNWFTDISMSDPETGEIIFKLNALRYHVLPNGTNASAEHTVTRSMWNPDITLLSEEQLAKLAVNKSVQEIIDLAAHKNPTMKIMEVDLGSTDTSSLWFVDIDEVSRPTRALYSTYRFITSDANNFVAVHEDLSQHRDSTATLIDPAAGNFTLEQSNIDLVIVKGNKLDRQVLESIFHKVRGLLSETGYAILVNNCSIDMESGSGSGSEEEVVVVHGGNNSLTVDEVENIAKTNDLHRNATVSCESCTSVHILVAKSTAPATPIARQLSIVSLANCGPISEMSVALEQAGWSILRPGRPLEDIQPNSTVLIQDELFRPVLKSVNESQWESLKHLVSQGCKVLWLTRGSQMNVTVPDNGLVHGLFRTIRQEDASLRIMTLDVHEKDSQALGPTVVKILDVLTETSSDKFVDNEFVERNGVVFVNRIVPDKLVNQFKDNESGGGIEPIVQPLGTAQGIVNLRAEQLGNLDALRYNETPGMPVGDEDVEIEIIAAGLNSEDVAAAKGIIPDNEHRLGREGAGVITKISQHCKDYKVGDRVVMLGEASFANKIRCSVKHIHRIPDSMSFAEGATIPMAYLTAIYCLTNVGNLQKNQTILIHAASDGVGIACIYLAKYIGAEIYVTVGSDEERSYLKEAFFISEDRIFSSKTTEFSREIKGATEGRGINLVINSLSGELLDESWRLCADNGRMVEIGRKDMIARHYLSMEPFERNCSYRPVSLSGQNISPTVVATLMTRCFELLSAGHIKPISPIVRFGFDRIPEAFSQMREGHHIGKIIISDGEKGITTNVPIRPPIRVMSLVSDVSYLVVGGLKGICGSLAVDMAAHGARHIIAMTRSGISDARSQAIVRDCNALGCEVQEAKADVCSANDVESAFKSAKLPVGGIIQGAVILRDKPFESMTLDDYYTAASAKVQGTWNLHHSSLSYKSPISFFTLLSSMSGIIGQKAQANYSAANVFMDAFANYRHTQGLPAHALDLGIIEEVGFAAREGGIQERMDDRIWQGVNESMVRRMFRYSILQQTNHPINPDSATQLIVGISLPQRPGSDLERDARFSPLFINDTASGLNTNAPGADENAKAVQAFLLLNRSKADKASLLAAGVEVLSGQFMKILRLAEAMEPARSLSAYGVDSLSAVEVRNWVRVELGVELTTLDITNASSLVGLCERLISKMPVVE